MSQIDPAIGYQIARIVADFHSDEFTTGKVQQRLAALHIALDDTLLEDYLSRHYRSALMRHGHWWDRRWRPMDPV
ncbi:hypothetical protein [Gallaecimonas sp. GXIMD4217]|uniref:hypothetical protein n=1 Tax=Gallaecimonas sp. GXIMD4217 TaxID=3131927 RepID=UPI00311B2F8C